jgi:ubiquinone/menaquinone biosynthesis C-methylase UbiE
MTKARIPETAEGIQDPTTVEMYDQMMRRLRDRGWIATQAMIKAGLVSGRALEVGPGPGYLGLDWLGRTQRTHLTVLDISPAMIEVASRNAAACGLSSRWRSVLGNALEMPFDDDEFDAVFTTGSLHEWADPTRVFDEIGRVLKSGGRYFVGDLRRDMSWLVRRFLHLTARPKAIRPGLYTSIDAAYTADEIRPLLERTRLRGARVSVNPIELMISGSLN